MENPFHMFPISIKIIRLFLAEDITNIYRNNIIFNKYSC